MPRKPRRQKHTPTSAELQRLVEAEVARRLAGTTLPQGAYPLNQDALFTQMTASQAPAKQGTPMFAPGAPLVPSPGLVLPDGPRSFLYPVGYNISSRPRSTEATSFDTLRNLAMLYDGIQLCEQVWLDTVSKLNLVVKPRPEIIAEQGQSASNQKYADKIRKYTDILSYPDKYNGYDLKTWLRAAVRDQLQIDAVAIYVRPNRTGGLHSLELVDGTCYAADMEILTKSGWKLFSEVDIETDLFATRNPETKDFEWQKATYFHEADWDSNQQGELYHFTSHALDLLVTPNHRMLVNSMPRKLGGSRHRQSGEVIISAKDLAENYRGATAIPATSEWPALDVEEVVIPATTPRSREITFTGDDFAAFMGMWLAEGCAPQTDQVYITQYPESKGYKEYKELLRRVFGFDPCHTGASWVIGHKALHDYLKQFGYSHEKFVPEIIKEMSRRQLGIFWHYYVLGDGHIEKSGREKISTVSKRMADDMQEILQKMGFSASISVRQDHHDSTMKSGQVISSENKRPCYVVRKRTSATHLFRVERKAYTGKIYCVSVPNEIIYVRRNGMPAWCGNTIKPLIDPRGRRPQPPFPAYQQFYYGVPDGWYTSEEMIYLRETPRTESIYGLSRVERIIMRVNQALRKQNKDLTKFTDGNIPPGLIEPPAESGEQWTPEQLATYQMMWDAMLSGNDQARSRVRVIAPGSTYTSIAEPDIYLDFDRFLLNVTTACYSMTMADLGFTENVNKSSGDSQENVFYRRAVQPLMERYAQLFSQILRDYFGEQDLIVTWGGFEEAEDFNAMAASYVALVTAGIIGPTAAAQQMKLPTSGPEIPPFLATKDGPVFLEDAANPEMRSAANDAKKAGYELAKNPPPAPEPGQPGKPQDDDAKATKGNDKPQDDEEDEEETKPSGPAKPPVKRQDSPDFFEAATGQRGDLRAKRSWPWRLS